MKKIKRVLLIVLSSVLLLGLFIYFKLPQVFAQEIKVFKGKNNVACSKRVFDSTKKTVLIVADNEGTEMFDLMAPFYLFNATGKANVFVVSWKKAPILLVNSLFILPHYTFSEIDSLHMHADVIVIPNVTMHLMTPPKPAIVNWIKKMYTGSNMILSICDGSATAAATGIYDGLPLTTHASDFETLKKKFPGPVWVKDIGVTESRNLYSTAGVANAVEGSVTVIQKLFGAETTQAVLHDVAYPYGQIRVKHESLVVNTSVILRLASKMLFRKNDKIGVLLTDSVNEFELAGVLDTYVRSFPKCINSFSADGESVCTKYGLTVYPSAATNEDQVDELHVFDRTPGHLNDNLFARASIIDYSGNREHYPIDVCLNRIAVLYGTSFKQCVKLMLDYN